MGLHEAHEHYDLHAGALGMHPALVLRTILVSISMILVPYLCYKFWLLKQHFIIHNRFPKVTIAAAISMLITTFTLLFVSFIEYGESSPPNHSEQIYFEDVNQYWGYNLLGAVGQSFSLIFCALIILRTHLIYELYKTTQRRLNNTQGILTHSIHATQREAKLKAISLKDDYFMYPSLNIKIPKLRVYQFIALLILIAFIIGCYLFYFRTDPYLFAVVIIFSLLWAVGVFVLITTRKTKEALACRQEAYIVLIVIAGQIINANVGRKYEVPKPWRYFVATMLALCCCYGLLVVSLWMIYSLEGGTINPEKIFRRKSQSSRTNQESEAQTQEQSPPGPVVPKDESFQGDLIDYLAKSRKEYDQFASFLAECFALENLLYFVAIITFRNVLLEVLAEKTAINDEDGDDDEKSVASQSKTEQSEDGKEEVELIRKKSSSIINFDQFSEPLFARIFSLKFEYLSDLHVAYKNYVNNQGMNRMAKDLYLQFIADEAVYIINISWQPREKLKKFFHDESAPKSAFYQFTIGSLQKDEEAKSTEMIPTMDKIASNSNMRNDEKTEAETGGGKTTLTKKYENHPNPNINGKTEIEMIHKYLTLFNESIVEVYSLMASVFQFRYQRFIKNKKVEFNSVTSNSNVSDLHDIPE